MSIDAKYQEIDIGIKPGVSIKGNLSVVAGSDHIIVFAHGSGSGRFSPRNNFVAEKLREHGFSTLLVDLLTPEEQKQDEITYEIRFDIAHLSRRLLTCIFWLKENEDTRHMKTGLYGASTGAAAAMWAANEMKDDVFAIVCRGGRVDMARSVAHDIKAAVLLIAGGLDPVVLALNKEIYEIIETKKKLEIVKGATHLFEEEEALERVADVAVSWFEEAAKSEYAQR